MAPHNTKVALHTGVRVLRFQAPWALGSAMFALLTQSGNIALTLITEAVFSRCLSSFKDERVMASELFQRDIRPVEGDKAEWTEALRQALLASKIISYAQGFMLMRQRFSSPSCCSARRT